MRDGMNYMPQNLNRSTNENPFDPFRDGAYSSIPMPPSEGNYNPFQSESPSPSPFVPATNPFEANPFAASTENASWQTNDSFNVQKAPAGERVRQKFGTAFEMGKRAVETMIRLMPRTNVIEKVKNAAGSEYGQKLSAMASSATGEAVKSAALGAAISTGERFGINYEDGAVKVKKLKLARAALRLARNPYGEIVRTAKIAGKEAYSSGKNEARHQAFGVGTSVAQDAFGYINARYQGYR